MKTLLAIALGGAVGAVGRHLVAAQVTHFFGTGFPFGTLTVNVIGSFVMGCLIETMALAWSPAPELRAFLTVGMLGAFTTFSTFSMEVVLFTERGQYIEVAAYVLASVALSVGGLFLGLHLVRTVIA
jgi:CrcB protein